MSVDWKGLAKRIDFKKYSKQNGKTYLLEVDTEGEIGLNSFLGEIELYEDRNSLIMADSYVDYNIKPDYINAKDFIIRYVIVEKFVDRNNNLFLIANRENYDIN